MVGKADLLFECAGARRVNDFKTDPLVEEGICEQQVRGDVNGGDERYDPDREIEVLAGHFGIEAKKKRGRVGEGDDGDIEDGGPAGTDIVAAEDVAPERDDGSHRAPIPRTTANAVFARMRISVSTE